MAPDEAAEPIDDQMRKFLTLVQTARWTRAPRVWNPQLREAIGNRHIKVGFGGVLEITDEGRQALAVEPVRSDDGPKA